MGDGAMGGLGKRVFGLALWNSPFALQVGGAGGRCSDTPPILISIDIMAKKIVLCQRFCGICCVPRAMKGVPARGTLFSVCVRGRGGGGWSSTGACAAANPKSPNIPGNVWNRGCPPTPAPAPAIFQFRR